MTLSYSHNVAKRLIVAIAVMVILSGSLSISGFQLFSGMEKVFAASVSISGTVTSATEPGGLEGVVVNAYDLDHNLSGSATTVSGGTYDILNLTAGDYLVEFASGGDYLGQWYDNKPSFDLADTVTVIDGTPASDINASLEKNIVHLRHRHQRGRAEAGGRASPVNAYDLDHNLSGSATHRLRWHIRDSQPSAGDYLVEFSPE